MAKNILEKEVGEFSILDAFFITGSKLGTSEISRNISFIGDGTLRSGLIKSIGALTTSYFIKNKYLKYMLSGILIDGMEDIVLNLKGQFVNKNVTNNNEVIL